jgi:hypothetical protein
MLRVILLLIIAIAPASKAISQNIFMISAGPSINKRLNTDGIQALETQNNVDAQPQLTTGYELTASYSWFPRQPLNSSTTVVGLQALLGVFQRGYQLSVSSQDSCLESGVYKLVDSYCRIGVQYGVYVPLSVDQHLVFQLGSTFGITLDASDNADDMQHCEYPLAGPYSVLPPLLVDINLGIGYLYNLTSDIFVEFRGCIFFPISSSEGYDLTQERHQIRSSMFGARNLSLVTDFGFGLMF